MILLHVMIYITISGIYRYIAAAALKRSGQVLKSPFEKMWNQMGGQGFLLLIGLKILVIHKDLVNAIIGISFNIIFSLYYSNDTVHYALHSIMNKHVRLHGYALIMWHVYVLSLHIERCLNNFYQLFRALAVIMWWWLHWIACVYWHCDDIIWC